MQTNSESSENSESARRAVATVGLTLVAIGVLHIAVLVLRGGDLQGPVSWRKPIVFCIGIGTIQWCSAWVAKHLRISKRAAWATLGVLAVTGFSQSALVVLQQWRGTASHFNMFTTDFNAAIAILIALTTFPVTIVFAILAYWSFTRITAPSPVRRAIRFGMSTVVLGTCIGTFMIAHAVSTVPSHISAVPQPPFVFGAAGILLLPHLLSLFGLHTMLALLAVLRFGHVRSDVARSRLIGIAAVAYAALIIVTAAEAFSGRPPFGFGVPSAVVWAAAALALGFAFVSAATRRLRYASTAVLMLALVGCEPEPDATRGEHAVGNTTLVFEDAARARELVLEVWYPAVEGSLESWNRPLPVVQPVRSARDAELLLADRRPLLLMSHGALGFRYAQAWLATNLASHGYLVAAVDHPGSMRGNLTGEGMFTLWNRALDISAVLDHLLADERFADAIDPARIAFASHSAGGHTGLLLAGAQFDPAAFRAYRLKRPPGDIYADRLAPMEDIDLATDPTPYERSYRDRRIRAFVLMAPSPIPGFRVESLRAIERPMHIYASKRDEINPLDAHARVVANNVPTARLEMFDAGHFVYIPRPGFLGRLVLPELFVDADDVDRGAIHAEVKRGARAFLDRVL